jgi:hypothetical protein
MLILFFDYQVLFPPYRSPFLYNTQLETIYSNDYVMLVAIVSCFYYCWFYVNCLHVSTSFDRRHVLLPCFV